MSSKGSLKCGGVRCTGGHEWIGDTLTMLNCGAHETYSQEFIDAQNEIKYANAVNTYSIRYTDDQGYSRVQTTQEHTLQAAIDRFLLDVCPVSIESVMRQ